MRARPSSSLRSVTMAWIFALLLPAAAVAAAMVAPATPPRPPAVELVETRPVETTLGNPALREAHVVWAEMLRNAQKSIDLEEFYCTDWPGERLGPVLDEIGHAATRGVRVRLLLDQRFHRTYPMPADSLGRLRNVELRYIDMGRLAGGVQHSKYLIVDGRVTFLGSQNLDWRALKHIHELGMRIEDPRVAAVFGQAFQLDWTASDTTVTRDELISKRLLGGSPGTPAPWRIALAPGDSVTMWAGYSPRGLLPDSSRWELPALIRLLDSARDRIGIQVLTYSTEGYGRRDSLLDQALRRAAGRGVKVSLLVSDWGTRRSQIGPLRSLAAVPGVEIRVSTLPEWSGGYIPFARVEHCKYAVVDGAGLWVGTGNWEPDYFLASRNLSVIVEHAGIAEQARRIFETSWTAPSAAPLRMDGEYPEKIHGETPPAGRAKYGG